MRQSRQHCKYSYSKILQSWSMDDDIYKHIWYRGQTSNDESKYRLWSTMVRNIQKDIKEGRKEEDYLYHSFVRYQRTHFELFKTLVDGAPEIPLYGTFSDADYVALMQHYGVDTNLIDFTDNAFIALYLALKYYSKEDRNTRNHRDCAIYLLNPVVYNRYRRNMLLEQIELMNLSEEKKAGAMKIYGIEDDDLETSLLRAYEFTKSYYKEYTEEECINNVYNQLNFKFGNEGKVRFWVNTKEQQEFLNKMKQLASDKDLFYQYMNEIIEKHPFQGDVGNVQKFKL